MNITLRGYAVPFGQVAHVGNYALEQFDPGAFDEMLAVRPSIDLRWAVHDDGAPRLASTAAGDLSFFADDYGLGFSATIGLRANWGRLAAMVQRKAPMSFCSIGGLIVNASHREKVLVGSADVVTKATIDHVAVVASPAYRHGTGIWRADAPLDDAPLRIQELDARWTEGMAAWKRKNAAAARRRPSTGLPTSVEAMFEARRGEIMALRARYANSPSRRAGGEVIGCVAFSKAADRIFGKLR